MGILVISTVGVRYCMSFRGRLNVEWGYISLLFISRPSTSVIMLLCVNRDVSMTTKLSFKKMRQVYKVTYPTGKIYIGKDLYGSYRYFGSPDPEIVNKDFETLPEAERRKYSVTKEILWESEFCSEKELAQKEVKFIREFDSNNPAVGYNRWPKYHTK